MAAASCPMMLPIRVARHRKNNYDMNNNINNVSEDFHKHFLCPSQMLRPLRNESTLGKHDHVSSVAATMCLRFAKALVGLSVPK